MTDHLNIPRAATSRVLLALQNSQRGKSQLQLQVQAQLSARQLTRALQTLRRCRMVTANSSAVSERWRVNRPEAGGGIFEVVS